MGSVAAASKRDLHVSKEAKPWIAGGAVVDTAGGAVGSAAEMRRCNPQEHCNRGQEPDLVAAVRWWVVEGCSRPCH